MKKELFQPEFFKILQLSSAIGIKDYIDKHPILVTYNQLMKTDAPISHVFIFDENEIEVPSLITYCAHFDIPLYKLLKTEVIEVQTVIKHAKLVAIEKDKELSKIVEKKLKKSECFQVSIDISNIKL